MTREERDCFAESVLSAMRFFATLRMTGREGLRMTGRKGGWGYNNENSPSSSRGCLVVIARHEVP